MNDPWSAGPYAAKATASAIAKSHGVVSSHGVAEFRPESADARFRLGVLLAISVAGIAELKLQYGQALRQNHVLVAQP